LIEEDRKESWLMKLNDPLDTLRQEFNNELAAKTGWERVEVKQVFERAISNSLANNTNLE
jgi:hypothetical protein